MSDQALNATLDQYIIGKRLAQSTGDISLQRRLHGELGLRKHPTTYLKLESLYSHWIEYQIAKRKKND